MSTTDDEMLTWVRATIEGDRAAAEAAVNEPRRIPYQVDDETALYGSRWVNRPVSDEGVWVYEEVKDGYFRGMGRVAAVLCEDKGVVSGSGLDGGTPADGRKVDLLHIAIHDPRDTIARCESDLAILDEHAIIERRVGWCETDGDERHDVWVHLPVCRTCVSENAYFETRADLPPVACRTVRLLATGYRHRPGWNPDWAAPTGTAR